MNEKKISVIIPTYRPGNWLYEMIDAVCAQTLSNEEFEIIIILNGERSPYEENINNYINVKTQGYDVKLLYSEKSGVSNARNMGLDHAQGEYIAFLDDDDLINSLYLEQHLHTVGLGYNVSMSNVMCFINDKNHLYEDYLSRSFRNNTNTSPSNIFKLRSLLSPVWGKLIFRNVIGNRRYNPLLQNGEDSLFMFEISDKINGIALCSKANYFRRVREGSLSRSTTWNMRVKVFATELILYSKAYFPNVRRYNFPFYLSRLIASFIGIFRA